MTTQHAAAPDTRADYAEFYAATYGRVVAHVYALTGDLGEAQEAAQEAFIKAWSRWDKVSTYDEPAAWARLVAQRVAVSRWRRSRTALTSWIRHGPVLEAPEPDPHSVALVTALRQVPEAQRRALVLHHMGGHSVAEIAASEGVAEGTIKARLSRGRVALAELLGDDDDRRTGPTAPATAAPPLGRQRSGPGARPPALFVGIFDRCAVEG